MNIDCVLENNLRSRFVVNFILHANLKYSKMCTMCHVSEGKCITNMIMTSWPVSLSQRSGNVHSSINPVTDKVYTMHVQYWQFTIFALNWKGQKLIISSACYGSGVIPPIQFASFLIMNQKLNNYLGYLTNYWHEIHKWLCHRRYHLTCLFRWLVPK